MIGTEQLKPARAADLDFDFLDWIRSLEEELNQNQSTRAVGEENGRFWSRSRLGRRRDEHEIHLDELGELARSAEVSVEGVITQNRKNVDPKTVIGQGKLRDLVIRAFQTDVDLIIFDQNLTPTQARNLSERIELRVIDRTQLILIYSRNMPPPGTVSFRLNLPN